MSEITKMLTQFVSSIPVLAYLLLISYFVVIKFNNSTYTIR